MSKAKSPAAISTVVVNASFGIALALFGLAHFLDMDGFTLMVTGGLDGVAASLAALWAYVLPLLMIVGGVLLVVGHRPDVAAWCAGIALASIAIGMPLKAIIGTAELSVVAPHVHNAFIWLLVFSLVTKKQ